MPNKNAEEWLEKFDHIIFACRAQNIRFQAPEYLICLQLCINQEALYWALPIFESLLDASLTIDDVTNFRNLFLDRFENPEEQEDEGEDDGKEGEKEKRKMRSMRFSRIISISKSFESHIFEID